MKNLVCEADTEKALEHWLKLQGFLTYHMETTIPGFPDRLAIEKGITYYIEVKHVYDEKKKIRSMFRPAQISFLSRLNDASCIVLCCFGYQNSIPLFFFDDIIKNIDLSFIDFCKKAKRFYTMQSIFYSVSLTS